jgi:ribonuclease P protein component
MESPRSRGHRLRPSREIVRVLREGKAFPSSRMVVYVAPGAGKSRAAWIAGRKIGPAVARNRARRVLREAWNAVALEVRAGYDMVIVARPEIKGAKAQDVVNELVQLLTRAGVAR